MRKNKITYLEIIEFKEFYRNNVQTWETLKEIKFTSIKTCNLINMSYILAFSKNINRNGFFEH